MALPILDGNQSATTLSTVLSGGEHTPAHTVVSLGSTAISNITSAVSGSVVSVSNFPASQTTTFGAVTGSVSVLNFPVTQGISGTVTANVAGNLNSTLEYDGSTFFVKVAGRSAGGKTDYPINISGTVTANVGIASEPDVTQFGEWIANGFNAQQPTIAVIGSVTANVDSTSLFNAFENYAVNYTEALPVSVQGLPAISGTVTVGAMPSGALTTHFGSVATANLAALTSCVTNTSRKYLLVQNIATSTVTIGIGFAPTTTQGIQLTAGAGLTFDAFTPTGAVYVLSSVTASNFTVLEA